MATRTSKYRFGNGKCTVHCKVIIEIVATRCNILKPKCTKFDFGWDSTPDHDGGAYSASQPLAGFKGLLLREGRGGRTGRKGKGGGERRGK